MALNLSKLTVFLQKVKTQLQTNTLLSLDLEAVEKEFQNEKLIIHSLLDSASDLIFIKDKQSIYRTCNQAFAEFMELKKSDIEGLTDHDLVQKELADSFHRHDQEVIETQKARRYRGWVDAPHGQRLLLDTSKMPLLNAEGEVQGILCISRDITEIKKIEVALNHKEALFDSLVNTIPDLIFHKDTQGTYINCNKAFADFLGRPKSEIFGQKDHEIFPHKEALAFFHDDQKVFANRQPVRTEHWVASNDGRTILFDTVKTPYFNKENELLGVIGISRDITKRHQMEQELRRLAITDSLTGIFNRRHLMQKANEEFKRSQRYQRELSLLVLDIDHFKQINDLYGHEAGDKALKVMTHQSKEILRESDIFGRFGGEEFVIILPESDIEQATITAERLRKKQEQTTIYQDDNPIRFTVSIGVSTLEAQDQSIESMLKRADKALYKAKRAGRNLTQKG